MTVLIVDDHEDTAIVTAFLLADRGMQPRVALGGVAALAAIHESPPDAILLDLMMPEMDGYEVLRRLKADPATRPVPVLLHTAGGYPTDDTEARKLGAAGLIAKGKVKPDELAARLCAVAAHC